jgi:hypothetical protein
MPYFPLGKTVTIREDDVILIMESDEGHHYPELDSARNNKKTYIEVIYRDNEPLGAVKPRNIMVDVLYPQWTRNGIYEIRDLTKEEAIKATKSYNKKHNTEPTDFSDFFNTTQKATV